jgi:hypothetical protein
MKKSAYRVAAAAAVAGLFATMAPLSAFAATEPTYDTTTDAPIYLMNGDTAERYAPGTQLDWGVSAGVILTAVPVTATTTPEQMRFPAPTGGALTTIAFISAPGSERTKSAWKAYGDSATLDGVGVLQPSVWPEYLGNGNPNAVKAAGGNYSMGVAYLKNNDLTVVSAYYTTINVDAGTGTWKFASPPPTCPTLDVEHVTTTSLAPVSADVLVGNTTILTATVASDVVVPGNVEFFKGTTSLGTVGLSAGSAPKTVTVVTGGISTYSAKYVENTVSGCPKNHFAASTSNDATVTGTVPPPPAVPNAPTESSLNPSTAHGASATYDVATHTASLNNIPAINNGKSVNVFGYSTPTFLGLQTIAGGTVTVNVSTLAAGVHTLAVADPTTGDVYGWATFTKTDAAISPTVVKTINADVAGQTPSDGEFSLTNTSGATVNLTNPALVNGASVVSGELGTFKVTDQRMVTKPGWKLSTYVTDFTKGTDTIAASALGIDPKIVSQAGTGATAPTLGAAMTSGSASYPWNFATLAGTSFSGVSTYNADLVFTAPAGKPAGTYNSTLTLTLISN